MQTSKIRGYQVMAAFKGFWLAIPAVFLLFQTVPAQSIASALNTYKKTFESDISDVNTSSFSGAAFHPVSGTLYVVDDNGKVVFELNKNGKLIRSISLSGFDDTEGIAYQGDGYFFIVEERLANIVRVKIPAAGSGPVKRQDGAILSLGDNWGNSGLEDISYDSVSGMAYAVKEDDPAALYRISLDANGNPASFLENVPFGLDDWKGDAAGIYALTDGSFLIVNQIKNKLMGFSPDGKKFSEIPLNMTKPEGITVDEDGGVLYVVGEPRELCVFERPNSPVQQIQNRQLQSGLDFKYGLTYQGVILFGIEWRLGKKFRGEASNLMGRRVNQISIDGFQGFPSR